jgi:hypothetical protein
MSEGTAVSTATTTTAENAATTTATLTYPAFRILGPAMALAAADPTEWTSSFGSRQLWAIALVLLGVWAAAPVVGRPVLSSHHWYKVAARHRNTLFAALCAVTAAAGKPPIWLTAVDAALLLGYLLAVDACAAGPIGVRQLRMYWPATVAAGGTAAVLAVTQLISTLGPTPTPIGRWLGGAGAGLAGIALMTVFLPRSRRQAQRPQPLPSNGSPQRLGAK